MTKVRRVDWWPDEYMGGTFGNLTVDEHGAYIIILNLIYSNGGPIFVDLGRLAHAGRSRPQRMRDLLDRLVAKGKLSFTADYRLANGRADHELGKTGDRIESARKAGFISGSTRHEKGVLKKRSSTFNRVSRTAVRNYQPYDNHDHEKSTDAAREPSPELAAAQARAPTGRPKPKSLATLAAEARAKLLKGSA
jgi:uncharacterized protein YdaU (DUF1376 family)